MNISRCKLKLSLEATFWMVDYVTLLSHLDRSHTYTGNRQVRLNATFVVGLLLNMMTSKEREQLIELNGTAAPHPRDSFKPSSSVPWPWVLSTSVFFLPFSHHLNFRLSRWKREPTEIKPSNNAPSNPVSGMSPKRLPKELRHKADAPFAYDAPVG